MTAILNCVQALKTVDQPLSSSLQVDEPEAVSGRQRVRSPLLKYYLHFVYSSLFSMNLSVDYCR